MYNISKMYSAKHTAHIQYVKCTVYAYIVYVGALQGDYGTCILEYNTSCMSSSKYSRISG